MHQDFNSLLEGFLAGALSEADEQRLLDMIGDPAYRALLEAAIDRMAEEGGVAGEADESLRTESLRKLQERLELDVAPAPKVRRMYWKTATAAAVIVAVAAAWWLTGPRDRSPQQPVAQVKDIPKVQGNVTLQLPDGRALSLDSLAPDAATASQASAFDSLEGTPGEGSAQAFYAIQTARGRQYRLLLGDGTIAYLNAASSIKFPASFNGAATRDVEISGEVYFEVAKNAAAPFRVKVNEELQVEVLGTHFNIKAYTDDREIVTSLLEGAVRLRRGGEQVVMEPGQQVTAAAGGGMRVATVDVSESIAWKEGRFELYGNIRGIMRQLQRWYDISDVEYAAGTDSTIMVATVSSSKKLSEVLDILEKTGSIHFDIEGNKITVLPTNQ